MSTTLTPNNADAGGADSAHAESGKNNKTAMITTAIGFIARFGLAVVWLVSGWQKLADPVTTKQSVAAYELFSRDVSDLIGTALPVIEIALGVMLLAGISSGPQLQYLVSSSLCSSQASSPRGHGG